MDRLWSREEILKMINHYGTSCEEIEKLIDEKISKISENIKLLWSNETMADEFPKTQINLLEVTKYKKIIIFYKNNNTEKGFTNIIFYLNNGDTILRETTKQLTYLSNSVFVRNISITPLSFGALTFDNCYEYDYNKNTSETANNNLIPCYICGVL